MDKLLHPNHVNSQWSSIIACFSSYNKMKRARSYMQAFQRDKKGGTYRLGLPIIIIFSAVKIGDAYLDTTGKMTDFKGALDEICSLLVSDY